MKTSDVVRKLVRACVDDRCTLEHERKFVDEPRAEALGELAREREQFVSDLERVGGLAPRRSDGSWAELLREAGRSLWVTAAGPNIGDAITTCRHSRVRTEASYEEAMQAPLPDEIQRLLEAQRRRLHEELDELDRLQFEAPGARP